MGEEFRKVDRTASKGLGNSGATDVGLKSVLYSSALGLEALLKYPVLDFLILIV